MLANPKSGGAAILLSILSLFLWQKSKRQEIEGAHGCKERPPAPTKPKPPRCIKSLSGSTQSKQSKPRQPKREQWVKKAARIPAPPLPRRLGSPPGVIFACTFTDGFDQGGREVSHTVVACPVVVDAAFPPAVGMLLQDLWPRWRERGEGRREAKAGQRQASEPTRLGPREQGMAGTRAPARGNQKIKMATASFPQTVTATVLTFFLHKCCFQQPVQRRGLSSPEPRDSPSGHSLLCMCPKA